MSTYKPSILSIFLKFYVASIILPISGYSQDYLWPVKAERALTAVFGEERPGRYHTGIDIRTFGETGYPLLAIDNGYISRIRTTSKKYGKTVYLKLHDGNTAVYAHLDHFTPKLDNLTNALHQHYGKYTIDHQLSENEYPFIKGEIIGYSGDTGGVSGPHLHFEIRDKNQHALNPFKYGLSLKDDIPPIVESLALIPLNRNSYINGISEEQVFALKKINDTEYILEDTVSVWGSVGMAVKTYDRITNQEFNFGIYNVNLFQNDQLIYSMQYDKINWEDAKSIYTEKNYSLARKGAGKFHHLFSHHQNQSLNFINNKSLPGITFNQSGFHNILINILDYAANKVKVRVVFSSDTIPKFDYSVNCINETCSIQFNTKEKFRPYFYLLGRYYMEPRVPANYYDNGNQLYVIDNIKPPLNVIEVYAKNKTGLKSSSTFHVLPNNHNNNITGNLMLNHYEHGVIIKFEETKISGMEAFFTLKKKGDIYRHNFRFISGSIHSSSILSPLELDNVSEIKVYYENPVPLEIFKMDQFGAVVLPDSTFNISLINNQLTLSGKQNTFYDTVYIWAQPVHAKAPLNGVFMSDAYKVQPNLIPFNKEVLLEIALNKTHHVPDHLSIYYYNEAKNTWQYMQSEFNSDSTFMQTNILSGEIFSIIKEIEAPELSSFIPEINGTYYSTDLEHISFHVEDKFSGIEGETDVFVLLDGKRVIFEYNSYQNKVRYPLKNNLISGKHILYVEANDRVGNKSVIEGDFYIK